MTDSDSSSRPVAEPDIEPSSPTAPAATPRGQSLIARLKEILVEHPGDSVLLHASPINISYEEGFSLLNPDSDPRKIDFPFAVAAHEVLAPNLRAFERGRLPPRAKHADVGIKEIIGHASRQRRFRPYHDKLDVLLVAESLDSWKIGGTDTSHTARNARVAG